MGRFICLAVALWCSFWVSVAERKFMLRLKWESSTITAVADGPTIDANEYTNYNELLSYVIVDDLVRAEFPTFRGTRPGDTYVFDWETNIMDRTQLGQTVKLWLKDYNSQDYEEVIGNSLNFPYPKSGCWLDGFDCDDATDRDLFCRSAFTDNKYTKIDSNAKWTCPTIPDGCSVKCDEELFSFKDLPEFAGLSGQGDACPNPVSEDNLGINEMLWSDCVKRASECNRLRADCRNANLMSLGYAGVSLPSEPTWPSATYGNRTHFSELKSIPITSGSRGEIGSVTTYVQFWASQCNQGEFVTADGHCATCAAGTFCSNQVTAELCPRGTSSAGGQTLCTRCPDGQFPSSLVCECMNTNHPHDRNGLSGTSVDVYVHINVTGWFQDATGQPSCKRCPTGHQCSPSVFIHLS